MWLRLVCVAALAIASTKEDDKVASIPGFEAQFEEGLGFDVPSLVSQGAAYRRHRRLFLHRLLRLPLRAPHHGCRS